MTKPSDYITMYIEDIDLNVAIRPHSIGDGSHASLEIIYDQSETDLPFKVIEEAVDTKVNKIIESIINDIEDYS